MLSTAYLAEDEWPAACCLELLEQCVQCHQLATGHQAGGRQHVLTQQTVVGHAERVQLVVIVGCTTKTAATKVSSVMQIESCAGNSAKWCNTQADHQTHTMLMSKSCKHAATLKHMAECMQASESTQQGAGTYPSSPAAHVALCSCRRTACWLMQSAQSPPPAANKHTTTKSSQSNHVLH